MARIRTIKPEFWTDERVVELDFWVRLLFIGLWNFADDEGRMVCSEKRIKMQIFPGDSPNIRGGLDELTRAGLIEVYDVEGIEYLQIPTFLKHQRVDHPSKSKIPQKPKESRKDSPSIRGTLAPEGKGREGNINPEVISSVVIETTVAPEPPAEKIPADAVDQTPTPPPHVAAAVAALRVGLAVGTAQHDRAGELWGVMAANGVRGTACHPTVVEMARDGVTVEELRKAIAKARQSKDGTLSPPYLAAIIGDLRANPEKANGKAHAWATDERATEAKARELGLWPAKGGESWDGLRNRIRAKIATKGDEAVR